MLSPPGMIHSTLSLRLFSIGVISPRLKALYRPLTISVFVIEFTLSKKGTSKPRDRISISPDFFQMIRQFVESFRRLTACGLFGRILGSRPLCESRSGQVGVIEEL